jgi:hypothetical protein
VKMVICECPEQRKICVVYHHGPLIRLPRAELIILLPPSLT